MKALNTIKSPGMETLCVLYTELIWLRHEIHRLEHTTIDIPPNSQSCHRDAWQTRNHGEKGRRSNRPRGYAVRRF